MQWLQPMATWSSHESVEAMSMQVFPTIPHRSKQTGSDGGLNGGGSDGDDGAVACTDCSSSMQRYLVIIPRWWNLFRDACDEPTRVLVDKQPVEGCKIGVTW